jgi:hypothetical protein
LSKLLYSATMSLDGFMAGVDVEQAGGNRRAEPLCDVDRSIA